MKKIKKIAGKRKEKENRKEKGAPPEDTRLTRKRKEKGKATTGGS